MQAWAECQEILSILTESQNYNLRIDTQLAEKIFKICGNSTSIKSDIASFLTPERIDVSLWESMVIIVDYYAGQEAARNFLFRIASHFGEIHDVEQFSEVIDRIESDNYHKFQDNEKFILYPGGRRQFEKDTIRDSISSITIYVDNNNNLYSYEENFDDYEEYDGYDDDDEEDGGFDDNDFFGYEEKDNWY